MKAQNEFMEADEMRACRREAIAGVLRMTKRLNTIKKTVRQYEINQYSMQLKRYYYYAY